MEKLPLPPRALEDEEAQNAYRNRDYDRGRDSHQRPVTETQHRVYLVLDPLHKDGVSRLSMVGWHPELPSNPPSAEAQLGDLQRSGAKLPVAHSCSRVSQHREHGGLAVAFRTRLPASSLTVLDGR